MKKIIYFVVICAFILPITSCDFEEKISDLEAEVKDLKEIIDEIKNIAYDGEDTALSAQEGDYDTMNDALLDCEIKFEEIINKANY